MKKHATTFIAGLIIGALAMYIGLWIHAGYKLVTLWPKICPSCYEQQIQD